MPQLSFRKTDLVQTIGPLAAGTDFQVREGACLFSTEAMAPDDDLGFRLRAGDTIFAAAGKTVRVQTATRCVLQYEALV